MWGARRAPKAFLSKVNLGTKRQLTKQGQRGAMVRTSKQQSKGLGPRFSESHRAVSCGRYRLPHMLFPCFQGTVKIFQPGTLVGLQETPIAPIDRLHPLLSRPSLAYAQSLSPPVPPFIRPFQPSGQERKLPSHTKLCNTFSATSLLAWQVSWSQSFHTLGDLACLGRLPVCQVASPSSPV